MKGTHKVQHPRSGFVTPLVSPHPRPCLHLSLRSDLRTLPKDLLPVGTPPNVLSLLSRHSDPLPSPWVPRKPRKDLLCGRSRAHSSTTGTGERFLVVPVGHGLVQPNSEYRRCPMRMGPLGVPERFSPNLSRTLSYTEHNSLKTPVNSFTPNETQP